MARSTLTPIKTRNLVAQIDRIAMWMEVNKPDNDTIHLYKNDWLYLLKAPIETLRPMGFTVTADKGLRYKKFRLRPAVVEVKKSTVKP